MQIFLMESILIITTIMIINPKVLNCFKIPPCQLVRKCIENSIKNMRIDHHYVLCSWVIHFTLVVPLSAQE